MKCGSFLYGLFLISLLTTRLGWPYKYSEESPRLRRLITLVEFFWLFLLELYTARECCFYLFAFEQSVVGAVSHEVPLCSPICAETAL